MFLSIARLMMALLLSVSLTSFKAGAYRFQLIRSFQPRLLRAAQSTLSPVTKESPPYVIGQRVNVTILSFGIMGATVQINDSSDRALVYQDEIRNYRSFRNEKDVVVGERLEGFIKHIRDDGKMAVQLRPKPAERIPLLMEQLHETFKQFPEQVLPIGDKSSPEDIMYFAKMSKREFKMAVGGLFKAGRVIPGPYETKLVSERRPE